jgi:hypothetical protein
MYEFRGKLRCYLRVNLLGRVPRLTKIKNLPGRGLTKVEKHCSTCLKQIIVHQEVISVHAAYSILPCIYEGGGCPAANTMYASCWSLSRIRVFISGVYYRMLTTYQPKYVSLMQCVRA